METERFYKFHTAQKKPNKQTNKQKNKKPKESTTNKGRLTYIATWVSLFQDHLSQLATPINIYNLLDVY